MKMTRLKQWLAAAVVAGTGVSAQAAVTHTAATLDTRAMVLAGVLPDSCTYAMASDGTTLTVTFTANLSDVGSYELPNDMGPIAFNVNGKTITGKAGTNGSSSTNGGAGSPVFKVGSGTTISISGSSGSITGGAGGWGKTGGAGAYAFVNKSSGTQFTVSGATSLVKQGAAGRSVIDVPTQSGTLTYNGSSQTVALTGSGYTKGGTTSGTAAGSYTATATPDSTHCWSDGGTGAKNVSWSIGKKSITPSVTLSKTSVTYGDSGWNTLPTVTVTGDSKTLVSGTDYTASWSPSSVTGAGTYTVTVTLKGNYSGSKTATYTVNQASVTVPTAKTGLTYNGSSQTGVNNIPSTTYASASGTSSATAAGSYSVTYTLTSTTNCKWADNTTGAKTVSWSIGKKSITPSVSLSKTSVTYGNSGWSTLPTVTVTGDSKTLASGTDYTATWSPSSVSGAGTYTVTVTLKGNYSGSKTATYTVNKMTLTVTGLAATNRAYDGTKTVAIAGGSLSGVVSGDSVSATMPRVGTVATADVGTGKAVTFTAITLSGTKAGNYTLTQPTVTVNITQASVTVPTAKTGLTYNGSSQTGVNNIPSTIYARLTAGQTSATAAGSYSATYALTSTTNCKWADNTTGAKTVSWSIGKKEVSLSWGTTTFTYNGSAQKPTCTAGNLVSGDSCTVTVSGEQTNAGGPYTATASGLSNSNYQLPAANTTTFTILKSTEKPFKQGAADPEGEDYTMPSDPNDWTSLTNKASYSEFDCVTDYDGEAHTIDTAALAAAYTTACVAAPTFAYSSNTNDASSWAAAPVELVDAGATCVWYRVSVPNYEDLVRVAKVVVVPREVTITFTAADKVFDGTAAATCTETNFENVVAGEGFTLDTSAMTFSFADGKIGEDKTVTATGYSDDKVTALEGTEKSNYTFAFADTTTASITENRKMQAVTITQAVTVKPWDSAKGEITVDYSISGLGGLDAETTCKVAFDVTANGQTASITNEAAKLTDGPQPQKAIDTVALFGKEVVAKDAKVKISLIAEDEVIATAETSFWLGPEGQPIGEGAWIVQTGAGCHIVGTGAATSVPEGFTRNTVKTATIDDGITEIGARFFKDFRRMSRVEGGAGLVRFGEKAFYRCLDLEEITIANKDFDMSSLENAVVYQMAIDKDGKFYMVPKVTVAGYAETLYGKKDLSDTKWEELGPVGEKQMTDYGDYRFFKVALKKIGE